MSSRDNENRLTGEISEAEPAVLRLLRETEQSRLADALAHSPLTAVAQPLGELHDELIRKVLRLAETELARQELGAPPVPYTYLLFGSGGRAEMTFSSDQDSGILFANPATAEEAAACRLYFSRLADTTVRLLIELGYPPCEGNVIASNPEWCLSLAEWQNKIDLWFANPGWEHVRYLLIFADGRPVAGDFALAGELKNRFFSDMLQSPVIVRRMMENTLRYKVLLGVFGQLLRERYGEHAGSLDIKYGAYIPMVNVFRLMAVQVGIRETSTLGRIAALQQAGSLTAPEAEQATAAVTLLLRLRLLTAVKDEGGQWIGSGAVTKQQLTKELAQMLKQTLKFGRKLQRRVERDLQDRFGGRDKR